MVGIVHKALKHSNLARLSYYNLVHHFRSNLAFKFDESFLPKALDITAKAFERIQKLQKKFEFTWRILIIPPVIDLKSKAYAETAETIARVAPVQVDSLGSILAEAPATYYFPADGHLSATGSALVARYLLQGTDP